MILSPLGFTLIKQDDGRSKQAIQLQNLINFGISLDF
jgi:hypothetical protein